MATPFDKQISNRNFLSPIGFQFTLAKEPKVPFFCNSARIPEITFLPLEQPSYLKNINIPATKLQYGDLNLRFLVDEDMTNYLAVYKWMIGLGFPESTEQFADFTRSEREGEIDYLDQYSDGSLNILNSNYNPVVTVKFKDLFPISLSSVEFNTTDTDINYFTAEAVFTYTVYEIVGNNGELL
jgi:hypothetical protein